MNTQAYLDGYMNKLGNVGLSVGSLLEGGSRSALAGKEIVEGLAPYVLAAPLLLGAGAGLVHSNITSPSKLDEEAVQKALEAAELEEFEASLKRRME